MKQSSDICVTHDSIATFMNIHLADVDFLLFETVISLWSEQKVNTWGKGDEAVRPAVL